MAHITDDQFNNGIQSAALKGLALRQQEAGYAGREAFAPPITCQSHTSIRILRLPDVMTRVGLCRASIYSHMRSRTFPQSISLGARAVGWLEHEIDAWLAAKIQARQTKEQKGADMYMT